MGVFVKAAGSNEATTPSPNRPVRSERLLSAALIPREAGGGLGDSTVLCLTACACAPPMAMCAYHCSFYVRIPQPCWPILDPYPFFRNRVQIFFL